MVSIVVFNEELNRTIYFVVKKIFD